MATLIYKAIILRTIVAIYPGSYESTNKSFIKFAPRDVVEVQAAPVVVYGMPHVRERAGDDVEDAVQPGLHERGVVVGHGAA